VIFSLGTISTLGTSVQNKGILIRHIQIVAANTWYLNILLDSVNGGAGSPAFSMEWESLTGQPLDDKWHHHLIFVDTQGLDIQVVADGTSIMSAGTTVNFPFVPPVTPGPFIHLQGVDNTGFITPQPFSVTTSGTCAINGDPINSVIVGTPPFFPPVGDMNLHRLINMGLAEFVFAAVPVAIDLTRPSVVAAFRDPMTGLPPELPDDGQIPIIDLVSGRTLFTIHAQILLSGGPDLFGKNYPGWSRVAGLFQDSVPTSQFSTSGNVTVPPYPCPWG
jgi:hypothetical protein